MVTKNVVKCEFVLGLANLMQETLGSTQQPQMLQMTAEIIEILENDQGAATGPRRPIRGSTSGV